MRPLDEPIPPTEKLYRSVAFGEEHLLVQHPGEYELVPFGVIHVECPIDHLPWHKRIVERARRWWKS